MYDFPAIYEYVKNRSRTLIRPDSRKHQVQLSIVDRFSLSSEDRMGVVTLYRQIFGNDPRWREGAYCPFHGWEQRVSLEEYESGISVQCALCDEALVLCHPPEQILSRLDEIQDAENTFLFLLKKEGEGVVGFTWGMIGPLRECCNVILQTRYVDQGQQDTGRHDLANVQNVLRQFGHHEETRFHYFEEIAIAESARNLSLVMELALRGIEVARSHDVLHSLYWTSPESPIYPLTLCGGFRPIHATMQGIHFLFCEDVTVPITLLSRMSPEQFAMHCAKALRMTKTAQ